jgi:uncharacterized membrane protein
MSFQQPWGQGRPVGAHPAMLASDAAREQAVEVLKGAYAEGRLPLEEYESRMGHAYQARTYGELDALTADIPRPPLPLPPAPPRTNGKAIAALACGLGGTMVLFPAFPAIVLGHLARREIRRTGEQGDWMAITGLALGYVISALVVVAVTVAVVLAIAAGHAAGQ